MLGSVLGSELGSVLGSVFGSELGSVPVVWSGVMPRPMPSLRHVVVRVRAVSQAAVSSVIALHAGPLIREPAVDRDRLLCLITYATLLPRCAAAAAAAGRSEARRARTGRHLAADDAGLLLA